MSYRQLAFSAAFLAAAIAVPAEAQETGKEAGKNDSTVADSAAAKPVKKGRFGGLVNKAKAVAGNKTVQAAAKNVGCNVVPGAAVASAVTGQGPCANTGIAGALRSAGGAGAGGGVKGAAAGAVAGAVTGALGSNATSLMGVSGMAGMPSAASVGTMQAMMRKGGALGGMSDDAAGLLVQQMLIQTAATNSMSSASSAAAIQQMLQHNGALKGMSAVQTNALVQQILIQSAAIAAMEAATGKKR